MVNFENFRILRKKQPLLSNELIDVAELIIEYELTSNGEYDRLSDEDKSSFQKRRERFFSVVSENRILCARNRKELFDDLMNIVENKKVLIAGA